MLVDRCLKLSAREAMKDILEEGRTELAAYNVYGEADFRGMLNETFTPTRPYVFLVMSKRYWRNRRGSYRHSFLHSKENQRR